MAEKSVQPGKKTLDPMFYIPEGVVELDYVDSDQTRERAVEQEEEDFAYDGLDDTAGNEDFDYSTIPEGPQTPDILGIISQTLRRIPSGQQVVDIVLDVTDVAGTSNYEIRVTKI